jgi:cellulose synthase/poly-beta-1,6-N-acetylglucosamine synthase-like glycosyltransferase
MSDESLLYVSVVIPVLNEERYLAACLSSLMALTYPHDRYEVLLVDNGSTDRTLEIARGFSGVAIYVKENAKVGAVRNYGAGHAKGSIIVFLDSDCVVRRDWLSDGVSQLTANPGSIAGGHYLLRENPSWLEQYWILASSARTNPRASLLGGCIFIPADIFRTIGGFDESLNAGEDNDLTARLRNAHYRVEVEPSLSVVHLGYPSRVRPFIARQSWHSSDYINGLPQSLWDKTFLLTLVFMAGLISVPVALLFLPAAYSALVVSALLVIISPAVLSAKRVRRTGVKGKSLFDYLSIYLVDWLYLLGRSLGVLSGLKKRLSFSSNTKVIRR